MITIDAARRPALLLGMQRWCSYCTAPVVQHCHSFGDSKHGNDRKQIVIKEKLVEGQRARLRSGGHCWRSLQLVPCSQHCIGASANAGCQQVRAKLKPHAIRLCAE
jgi:hypothetical protein